VRRRSALNRTGDPRHFQSSETAIHRGHALGAAERGVVAGCRLRQLRGGPRRRSCCRRTRAHFCERRRGQPLFTPSSKVSGRRALTKSWRLRTGRVTPPTCRSATGALLYATTSGLRHPHCLRPTALGQGADLFNVGRRPAPGQRDPIQIKGVCEDAYLAGGVSGPGPRQRHVSIAGPSGTPLPQSANGAQRSLQRRG